jgi:hypothetical protein
VLASCALVPARSFRSSLIALLAPPPRLLQPSRLAILAQPERDYTMAFTDDKDEAGHPLVRRVPPRYVVQMRQGAGK